MQQAESLVRILKARALLLQQVRAFFYEREVLEVETPLLSHAIGTDPNLSPILASYQDLGTSQKHTLFLQTSPEFSMKRLLAAGSGPIFQICKAFRQGETSSRHNPEFTMLEWYRPGMSEHQLMDEVATLVFDVLGIKDIQRLSYRALFQRYLDIDPHQISLSDLEETARTRLDIAFESDDRDTWLDLLYSHLIEPALTQPVFIYNYPKSQAALAQITTDDSGQEVARRFELVVNGLELANGYFELRDLQEQKNRFEADLLIRKQQGLPQYPLDMHYLAALEDGLPECAGVALGLDRLLMLVTGSKQINEVMPITIDMA